MGLRCGDGGRGGRAARGGHYASDRGVLAASFRRASPSASRTTCGRRWATSPRSPRGSRTAGPSISRSTPAWRAPGSAGPTAPRSPRRRGCWRDAARLGGRVHPFPFLGHRSRRRPQVQWERFEMVLSALPSRPPLVHAANSAAALVGHPLRRRPRAAGHLPLWRRGGRDGAGTGGAAVRAGDRDASAAGRRLRELWRHLDRAGPGGGRDARHRVRGRRAAVALAITAPSRCADGDARSSGG